MRLALVLALIASLPATPGSGQDALRTSKDRPLDEWLAQMNDPMAHPDERRDAATAVLRIIEGAKPNQPEVLARLPQLQMAIVDAPINPEAGKGAAQALAHIGPGARVAVPALLDLVATREEYYQPLEFAKEAACEALVAVGVSDEAVWSALKTRIRFRGPHFTETAAVMALGQLAPPEVAVPFLTETLGFGNNHYVLAAGRALAEIGEPARSALPDLLKAIGAGEESGWWETLLAMLPGNRAPRERYFSSGPAAALLVLGERDLALELLDYQVTSLEDAFSGRRGAVESLWYARAAGYDDIGPLLVKALSDTSKLVRRRSLSVLERLGPAAEPALESVTEVVRSDPDDFTQVAAMQTRWAIVDGDVDRLLPLLVECTEDAEYRVRGEAARQIGRLGRSARSARPAIERLTSDPHKWVQGRARWALRRLN